MRAHRRHVERGVSLASQRSASPRLRLRSALPFSGALAALSFACGFPEVSFENGAGGASSSASSTSTSSASSGGAAGQGGAGVGGAGAGPSVGGGGAGGGGPDPCDLDGDGKPAATPECMGAQGAGGAGGVEYDCDDDNDGFNAVGAPCNGTDCFDANAEVYPGQTQYFGVHRGDGSFDYDCNGQTQLEYGSNACGCQGGGTSCLCNQRAVLDGATGCGTTGTFKPCNNPFIVTSCSAQGAGVTAVLKCR